MKETTRSAVIAVLAIVAVAFVAATLNTTVTTEQRGPSGSGSGSGDGDGGLLPAPQSGPTPGESVQLPFLSEVLTVLAGIAVIAILVYLILYWRDALKIILTLVVLFGLLFILVQVLSSQTSPAAPPLLEPGNGSVLGGGGGGESDTIQPSPASLILLLILGLALAGAIIALFRTTTNDSEDLAGESETGASNAAAVGRAAGRAADRLEQEADVDNEVYRTWREMTDLLAVPDPQTSTPGEFADAAVEAGLGREDVGELTRLFEDVRYGEMEPSDEHERQAVTIFRRIEDRYAEDES